MKKTLSLVSLIAGMISITSLIILGYLYLEDAGKKINGATKRIKSRFRPLLDQKNELSDAFDI